MRAIQWPGPDVQRKWDQATALNYIDLDAEIMPSFKTVLINDHVLSPDRADVVF